MANTGYIIITYIDVNPKSPTFNTTRQERMLDDVHCGVETAIWTETSFYCEIADNGTSTGYIIRTETDVNYESPTYGQTRETRSFDSSRCPSGSTDPFWVIDDGYCEIKTFPSGIEGQTGKYIVTLRDENFFSPTFDQTTESAFTESSWTESFVEEYGEFPCEGVDTNPKIEPISETCVIVVCNNISTTNGQKKVFGLDKNIYSDTYLQSVTQIVTDEVNCPNKCSSASTYTFKWSEGTTAKTTTINYDTTGVTFGLISKKDSDDSFVPYTVIESCDWLSSTTGTSSVTFTMTPNETEVDRTCFITLKQDESDKEIVLTLTQKHQDISYTFTWGEGTTAKTTTINYGTTGVTYNIISKKDSDNTFVPYLMAESCNWVSCTTGTSSVTFTMSANTTSEDRTCNIKLRQNYSNKEIILNLTQKHQPSVQVYAVSDKYLIDGTSASTFTIHYWAVVDGVITTNGVTLESVPLESGETAFTYTETSSGNDGKLYKTYTADQNTVNKQKTARFRAKYSGNYSSVVVIKQSGVDQTVLPDFDFLTFTFNWAESGGKDLDTATFVLGTNLPILNGKTLDVLPVGYGCDGNSSTYSAATSPYLQYGGDNMQSGDECALVNWKKICDHDFISEGITTLYCDLYGNWYHTYGDGKCSVTFKTYKGEGMKHGTDTNPYVFVPSGDTELVTTFTASGAVSAFSATNASERKNSPTHDEKGYYSHIGRFEYDIASKSAFFTTYLNTPSGRNIRGYGTVGNTSLTGANTENIAISSMTVDASSHSGETAITNFYNLINGVRKNATSYEVELKYYSLDGNPLQEGYATASISNGTLTWNINSNTTLQRREVDILVKGIQEDRNIIYRLEIKQGG